MMIELLQVGSIYSSDSRAPFQTASTEAIWSCSTVCLAFRLVVCLVGHLGAGEG